MNRRTLRCSLAGFLAVASLAGAPVVVQADKPLAVEVEQSGIDPALSAHCGFEVAYHAEARINVHPRGNGAAVTGVWRVTYTNVETGQSATSSVLGQSFQSEAEEDGLLVIEAVHSGPTVVKGARGGVAWVDSGRLGTRLVYDVESGELVSEETIVDAGASFSGGAEDALCSILSE